MCLKGFLSHGADPHEVYGASTVWSYVLDLLVNLLVDFLGKSKTEMNLFDLNLQILDDWLDVAEVFISHGASASLI